MAVQNISVTTSVKILIDGIASSFIYDIPASSYISSNF